MRVLVTGGSSFLGSALVRQLSRHGHDIRVLTRQTHAPRRLSGAPCTIFTGDIRDPASVIPAVRGCDAVVHAAYAPYGAPDGDVTDVAIRGMAVVLDECARARVGRLMLVSSPLACGSTVYGAGKLACESMAADWASGSRHVTIVRPFNPYGPDMGTDHVIPQFILRMIQLDRDRADGILTFALRGSGEDLRSFSWRADCAAQLCDILEETPRAAVYRCDAGAADVRTIISVSYDIANCFGRVIRTTTMRGFLHSDPPTRQVPQNGRPPLVSFGDGLARTVAWYREHEKEVLAGARQV